MDKAKQLEQKIYKVEHLVQNYLQEAGISTQYLLFVKMLALVVITLLVAAILGYIAHRIFLSIFHRFAKKTATQFDDFLLENKTISNIALVIPYIVVYNGLTTIFADFPGLLKFAKMIADCYMVWLLIIIARSFLRAGRDYLKTTDKFKDKPIESFVQLIMIFLYITGGLVVFSLLTGKSVLTFLTAMGAASAVLLLVFKDTILGFVASIQVSINDMVRIGDWISMDKYSADGDVVEINLATVKVQNWDKTITTIPTYYLISDSFKNWRGMQDSGGRRIKRALHIKISSVRHLSDADIEELMQITLLKNYLQKKQKEITDYNQNNNVDKNCLVNGRHLTNIGVFRQYINEFIGQHPDLHKDMTMMVRQLEPTTTGMAVEIYAFSSKTDWKIYEEIMSDIFDHLMASIPYFKLETFEMPTSGDIRQLKTPTIKAELPEQTK